MGLFDTDRWNEIWQTIVRNRKRSLMTALGVFWGIFMLTVLLGAGSGIERLIRAQLGPSATNTTLLTPMKTSLPYRGMPADRSWQLENEDLPAVRRQPEVRHVSGVIWLGSHPARNGSHKGDYSVMGYTPEYQKINPSKVLYGRYLNDIDILRRRKVCLIGTQVWHDLFPGESDPTGQTLVLGGSYFTVVGVLRRQGQMMAFSDLERTIILPASLSQQLFGLGNQIHLLSVAGHDHVPPSRLEQAIKSAVFPRHLISPDDPRAAWVMSAAEFTGKVNDLFRGINLLTWIVGLGSLFAGIVGVSNIMLVLVKERTQEIGIRRALGASPRTIIAQILSESFILTFISGVIGLASGVGLLSAADTLFQQAAGSSESLPAISWQITFGTGMLSLGILIAGGLASGIIPTLRALRIKAVDAIREE